MYKNVLNTLEELTRVPTVSGFESGAYEIIKNLIDPSCEIFADKLGSIHVIRRSNAKNSPSNESIEDNSHTNRSDKSIGGNSHINCADESIEGNSAAERGLPVSRDCTAHVPTILLDAHIDEIGFCVTAIEEGGFLRVAPIGGIDARTVCASEVEIYGKDRTITGIVCSTPPHLADGSEGKLPKIEDILIDTGYSKEELEKLVGIGIPARFKTSLTQLENGRVTGGGLDDKACAAVILQLLDNLRDAELSFDIHALFSTQEETSSAGARTGVFPYDIDLAIVMDVNFAEALDCDPRKCIKMGGGAGFSLSVSTCLTQTRRMMQFAQDRGIKCQAVVEATSTGTNAEHIRISREGIPTVVASIPLRNMHTPSEIVELGDIEATAQLLGEYLVHEYGVGE